MAVFGLITNHSNHLADHQLVFSPIDLLPIRQTIASIMHLPLFFKILWNQCYR